MMNATKIAQLKAAVEAARAAAAVEVAERAEISALESLLKLESSPALVEAKVKLAAAGMVTAKLSTLIQECGALVANVPVYNPKTRTNRQWKGSRRFSFGPQIDLIYQLCSGILYSVEEHRSLLLAHTGLTQEVVEEVITAMGTPTYYSRVAHTIVEAKMYDFEKASNALAVLQSQLGVSVDTSAFTESNLELEFIRAIVTAQKAYDMAEEAIKNTDFVL